MLLSARDLRRKVPDHRIGDLGSSDGGRVASVELQIEGDRRAV
jgi:hypothetical protein